MAIVTISRSTGSGGAQIGRTVSERLGYEYFGKKQLLREVEEFGGQWLRWTKEMDEREPSLWERFDQSFAGVVALGESLIYEHARRDHVVIVDRRAHWLLRDTPFALRTRVTAPREYRIDTICEREEVDRGSAAQLVDASDRERAAYMEAVYGIDWTDPTLYDQVYDLGARSADQIVADLIGRVPERDRQATPEAREQLNRTALVARVKASIMTDLRITVPTLEVEHDGEAIVLRGVVSDLDEQRLVLEVARLAAAPTPVKSELRFRGM